MLRSRFAAGELSLDQVDAVSKLATPDTEEAVISECLGLAMRQWIEWQDEPILQGTLMRWILGGNGGCRSNTPWTGFVAI
jgi:hypothetical protein